MLAFTGKPQRSLSYLFFARLYAGPFCLWVNKKGVTKRYIKEGQLVEFLEVLVARSLGGIELHHQAIDIGLLLPELLLAGLDGV